MEMAIALISSRGEKNSRAIAATNLSKMDLTSLLYLVKLSPEANLALIGGTLFLDN